LEGQLVHVGGLGVSRQLARGDYHLSNDEREANDDGGTPLAGHFGGIRLEDLSL
jgi:hypothetical protein